MLLDFHLNKIINQVEPQLVALAVISLALQIYGIQIPCTTEQDQKPWHEVISHYDPIYVFLIGPLCRCFILQPRKKSYGTLLIICW